MSRDDAPGDRAEIPRRFRRAAQSVVETVIWGAIAFGVWILTLSSFNGEDAVVAGGVAALCGALATAGRWAIGERWAIEPDFLRHLPHVPAAVLVDTVEVLTTPLRRRRGSHFSTVRIARARGEDRKAATWRAHATLLISFTPGSYVCDIDPESGDALLHHLGGPGPSLEEHLQA